ncbi:hypothetical protein D3C86_1502070 [compost metagenome]
MSIDGFDQHISERIDGDTLARKRQALAFTNAVHQNGKALVFHGAADHGTSMYGAVGVHVAIQHENEVGVQLGQRASGLRKLDVITDEHSYS